MSLGLLDKVQKTQPENVTKRRPRRRKAPRLGAHKYLSNALLLLQAFGMQAEEIEIAWGMLPEVDRWPYIERLFEVKIDVDRMFSDYEFSILRVVAGGFEIDEFLDQCVDNPLDHFRHTGPIFGFWTLEPKMEQVPPFPNEESIRLKKYSAKKKDNY